MSRSSLTLGLIVAVLVHAALFLPSLRSRMKGQTDPAERTAGKIVVVPPPPAPPTQAPGPAVPQPSTPPAAMQQVVRAAAEPPDHSTGDTAARESDAAVAPMTITWESPDHLRAVAGALGLRIVAADGNGRIVGHVACRGPVRLMPFEESLGRFSNRVRTLPAGYFGADLAAGGTRIAHYWILVPAAVDERFLAVQRQAAAARGIPMDRVRLMTGSFRPAGDSYELVITNIS